MTLVPGARIGPYQISAPLGAGGMGEVFRATDPRLGRDVAVQVLPAAFGEDRERVARFAREARLLASVHHAGIAAIHAFEEVEGRQLLVMELVEGESLDARLARGPLPVDEALEIARYVAEALEEAHEHGIVHRDLKPANVRIGVDGRPKLLDFGLAKAMAPASSAEPALSNSPTMAATGTVDGVILGTAPYMSPEQARGRAVDRRTDVWAFGVLLWEMLTGRHLFSGSSVTDVLANVLKQPVDLDALPEETPPSVRRLLARCLDRDPRTRLRDVGEARVALETPGEQAPTTLPAPRARNAGALVAVAFAAAALGALGVVLFRPVRPAPPIRSVSFPVDRLLVSFKQGPAVSPDGTRILFVADGKFLVQSLVDPLAAPLELARIGPGPDLVHTAFWSFDGANVVFAKEDKLWRIPGGGGTPTVVCDIPELGKIQQGDWSAADEIVFSVWNGSLYRVPATGGRAEVLLERDPKTELDFHSPVFLPEGRGVLFVTHLVGEADPHRVEVLAGKRRVRVLDGTMPISRIVYAPGHLVFDVFGKEGLWEVPFSPSRLAATGRPRLALAEGAFPSTSRDGTLVFSRGSAAPLSELVWVSSDGTIQTPRIAPPSRAPNAPAISPDGRRIALSSGVGDRIDLSLVDLARGSTSRLLAVTAGADSSVYPTWALSSDRILYREARGPQSSLRVVETSNSAEPVDVVTGAKVVRSCLEPDGRHLLYTVTDDAGRAVIYRVALDSRLQPAGAPVRFAGPTFSASRLAVAPQGDLFAYPLLQPDGVEIFLAPLEGTARWPVSSGGGDQPCWSRAGDRLFYVAGDDLIEVEVPRGATVSHGPPPRHISFAERGHHRTPGFDVASDGRFLMVRASEPKRAVVVVNGVRLLEAAR
jgi:serine/threonine-protein kinase